LQPQEQPQLLPQPELPQLLFPQQQIRMTMMMSQRQEQLLPLLKFIIVTSL